MLVIVDILIFWNWVALITVSSLPSLQLSRLSSSVACSNAHLEICLTALKTSLSIATCIKTLKKILIWLIFSNYFSFIYLRDSVFGSNSRFHHIISTFTSWFAGFALIHNYNFWFVFRDIVHAWYWACSVPGSIICSLFWMSFQVWTWILIRHRHFSSHGSRKFVRVIYSTSMKLFLNFLFEFYKFFLNFRIDISLFSQRSASISRYISIWQFDSLIIIFLRVRCRHLIRVYADVVLNSLHFWWFCLNYN